MPESPRSEKPPITLENAAERINQLRSEVHKAVVGQDELLEQLLIGLFARGHCLTLGIPGVGRNLMLGTLARALGLRFGRLRLTPDLAPGDLAGTESVDFDEVSGKRTLRFVPGPLFAHVFLAEEINRAPPKIQAALLQAMRDREVTVAGKHRELETPFFVVVTQNPVEDDQVHPLLVTQLDRFMLSLRAGYPSRDVERQIIHETTQATAREVEAVLDRDDVLAIQDLVPRVSAEASVIHYAVDLVRATRPKEEDSPQFIDDWLAQGAGPRAAQQIVLGAKARAMIRGRASIRVGDIQHLAYLVMRHRLVITFPAKSEGVTSDQVIERLLQIVPEPQSE